MPLLALVLRALGSGDAHAGGAAAGGGVHCAHDHAAGGAERERLELPARPALQPPQRPARYYQGQVSSVCTNGIFVV